MIPYAEALSNPIGELLFIRLVHNSFGPRICDIRHPGEIEFNLFIPKMIAPHARRDIYNARSSVLVQSMAMLAYIPWPRPSGRRLLCDQKHEARSTRHAAGRRRAPGAAASEECADSLCLRHAGRTSRRTSKGSPASGGLAEKPGGITTQRRKGCRQIR